MAYLILSKIWDVENCLTHTPLTEACGQSGPGGIPGYPWRHLLIPFPSHVSSGPETENVETKHTCYKVHVGRRLKVSTLNKSADTTFSPGDYSQSDLSHYPRGLPATQSGVGSENGESTEKVPDDQLHVHTRDHLPGA